MAARRSRRAQSAVLAAVPALDRRCDEAALDSAPAGGRIDATDAYEWQFPVGDEGLEGVRVRRPQGGDAVPLEGERERVGLRQLCVEREGTAAALAPGDGLPGAAEVAPNKFHNIPCVDQCRACHVSNRTEILGFNALQLSTDRDPNALHGEPLAAGMVTLETLSNEGLLAPARPELVRPPRIAARSRRSGRCSATSPATAARATTGRRSWRRSGCTGSTATWRPVAPTRRTAHRGRRR